MKALYRHKKSGDLFAIETDEQGSILSTAGPLLCKDIGLNQLSYEDYFTSEIKIKKTEFELLSKVEYEDLLRECSFYRQRNQMLLF